MDSQLPQTISTDSAPKAIGPYAQAIRFGDFLFTAGQIPLDPQTMELVAGDVRAQTQQVMSNLRAVLTASGTGFDRVVKTTIFVTDLGDFQTINEVYATAFDHGRFPARSTVQVAALPKGAKVEIEMVVAL